MWNLEAKGYFSDGRYLTIRPPQIPLPLPPARLQPYDECMRRLQQGLPPDPKYVNWWSPPNSAQACFRETKLYDDRNKDHGTTIKEAIAHAPRLQAHLKMADRYLVALRDGMSIAWLLKRTFVFPHFGCLCDRSEWPDIMPTCRLENSDLEFPFRCPLNFLLNVHFMQGVEAGDGQRHGVPYKEHTFLDNPRLSERLKTDRAEARRRHSAAQAKSLRRVPVSARRHTPRLSCAPPAGALLQRLAQQGRRGAWPASHRRGAQRRDRQ